MFPSKFLQFPSILTHFHAANEKIQNGGRDLAISRGLVWVKRDIYITSLLFLLILGLCRDCPQTILNIQHKLLCCTKSKNPHWQVPAATQLWYQDYFFRLTICIREVGHHDLPVTGQSMAHHICSINIKLKCCLFDKIFVTGSTRLHFDRIWCIRWWKFHDIPFSVTPSFRPIMFWN